MRKPKRRPCFLEQGLIYAINLDGTVRVQFPNQGNLISYWLKIPAANTQDNKEWNPFDIGELVYCLMDEHFEDGIVIGAVYSTVDTPPAGATVNQWIKSFSDGTVLQYDRSAHALTVTLGAGGTASLTAPGGLTIDGNISVTGTLTASTDVVANGISLKSHVHPGVESGSDNTGAPTG